MDYIFVHALVTLLQLLYMHLVSTISYFQFVGIVWRWLYSVHIQLVLMRAFQKIRFTVGYLRKDVRAIYVYLDQ